VGIESIVGQQLPAFVGDQSDRVDDVLADNVADEVVQIDASPTRFDALTANLDLFLDGVRLRVVEVPPPGTVGTVLRTNWRRTTRMHGVCGPPMNLCGERKTASL
jgi:hypothetical protein